MRKRLWGLVIIIFAAMAKAQSAPAYLLFDASGDPYPSGSGTPLTYTPPSFVCYTNVTGTVLPCDFSGGGGGGNVSTSGTTTSGIIPVFNGPTSITNSLLSDDGTTLTYTGSGGLSISSITLTGATPGAQSWGAGTGTVPTLLANSAGFLGPVTGGTSYLIQFPGTITAGILHVAAPTTINNVNVSVMTSSLVSLTADVNGLLPVANGGTGTSSPGLVEGTNITITGSWPNQTITASATGATAFSALTGSTNTSAAMVVGTSASLDYTGTGIIDANEIFGATIPASIFALGSNGSHQLVAAIIPLSCQPGIGDGLNAIPAGTYLTTTCRNETGQTWTLTAIRCVADAGSSTCNATNGAGTALLTGAITGTSTYANGTQSGTTTIASGDYLKITFITDGTTKQIGIDVAGTY